MIDKMIDNMQKSLPSVSVVITAYNVDKYLEQAVDSALMQGCVMEVLIVDDCSTDGTSDLIAALTERDGRVRCIRHECNLGAGLARRTGIQHAQGEYVLLLDGDDYLQEGFVEALCVRAAETGAEIVSGGITVLHDEQTGKCESAVYGDYVAEGVSKVSDHFGERIVFMNNKIILRSLHAKFPYCERRFIEDTPVIVPMLYEANRVAYVNHAGYVYRMNPTSLTHTSDPFKENLYRALCFNDLKVFFADKGKEYSEKFNEAQFNAYALGVASSATEELVWVHQRAWDEFVSVLLPKVNKGAQACVLRAAMDASPDGALRAAWNNLTLSIVRSLKPQDGKVPDPVGRPKLL